MRDDSRTPRRVRYYSVGDLAAGYHLTRAVELAERFDVDRPPTTATDVLELHNVQLYLEQGMTPNAYTAEQRDRARALVPAIRSTVARFFTQIDNANFAIKIADVERGYRQDLIDLLGRNKAFTQCDAGVVLPALKLAGVRLGDVLRSAALVHAYDREIRDELLATSHAGEYLIRKFLQFQVGVQIHLPRSLSAADASHLLGNYIDSAEANPNFVGLIAEARESTEIGIDDKLKLRAKRRREELVSQLIDEGSGFTTRFEVAISASQEEPALLVVDASGGLMSRATYSREWLDATCDYPSILNNFQYLFEFADEHVLLVLPSYPSQLGVMERLLGTVGKTEYEMGAAFRAVDTMTLLQTNLYRHYLQYKGIDLEQVIAWFFEEYLVKEFNATNFAFSPSAPGPYLQKVRHLFAEMEGVANQYALFVREGELDRELLTVGKPQARFKEIPSLLGGKYLYPTDSHEVANALHLLFSDQSPLNYISEDLNAENAALLVSQNEVAHTDFHDYQRSALDHLIDLGIIEDTGRRVRLAKPDRTLILLKLFTTQCANYYHLSSAGREEADAMVARGWIARRSSLLSEPEANYVNYLLNNKGFSNGPALRNKYQHGAQSNARGEEAHVHAYLIALRLIVALVIKINDDFVLAAAEQPAEENT